MQMVEPACVQLAQQVHDRFAVGRIQVSGGLVRQQNQRIAAQRARHGHALLLAARKLRRVVLHAVRHAHALQSFLHAPLALRRGMPR